MSTPMQIKIKSEREGARVPVYGTAWAAGADLHACLTETMTIMPDQRCIVSCGFSMELPEGWEAQIRPRSGIAIKHGITVLNSPGTIDADYRGEVCVMLFNTGDLGFAISDGDRIAQMVFARAPQFEFVWVDELEETVRGACGFGSTGVASK